MTATLEKPGFYPAGGGRFTVAIEPSTRLDPLTLLERGATRGFAVEAVVAGLSSRIAERELASMALAGGGAICTLEPSSHTRTQAELIPLFLPVEARTTREAADRYRIDVG